MIVMAYCCRLLLLFCFGNLSSRTLKVMLALIVVKINLIAIGHYDCVWGQMMMMMRMCKLVARVLHARLLTIQQVGLRFL